MKDSWINSVEDWMSDHDGKDRSSSSGRTSLQKLAQQYRGLWHFETPPVLSEFVIRQGRLSPTTIAELVLVDLEERINRGESISVEHYFEQYPDLASDTDLAAELIAAEYDFIAARYPAPPVTESHVFPPNVLEATSTKLLRRAAAGESRAWELLVQIYGPVVRYWCRQAGLNQTDVADAFSETFLAVVRNLSKFKRQEGQAKFRAWLKTVTLSKINNHFEKQGRRSVACEGSTAMIRLEDVEASPNSDNELDELETEDDDAALAHSEEVFLAQRMLQLVRKEFRENTWQAFYRTTLEGCTSQQAAKELSMTPLAVRKAKSRVMRRLREALGGSVRNQ